MNKTAARPAKNGDVEVLQCVKHIVAIVVRVGDGGAFSYPETTVDAGAEVFGKLTVDVAVDDVFTLCGVNGYRGVALSECRHGHEGHESDLQ